MPNANAHYYVAQPVTSNRPAANRPPMPTPARQSRLPRADEFRYSPQLEWGVPQIPESTLLSKPPKRKLSGGDAQSIAGTRAIRRTCLVLREVGAAVNTGASLPQLVAATGLPSREAVVEEALHGLIQLRQQTAMLALAGFVP